MTHKTIGIIGFGNQGRAWALNLRDSAWDVHVLLRKESPSLARVHALGLKSAGIESLSEYPVLAVLLPDDAMPDFFTTYGPRLAPNQSLVFAHGFCLHYQTIDYPSFVDVILLAPKGIGTEVRYEFQQGRGVPCVLSIHQDHTGRAKETASQLCEGLGAARAGIYSASASQEVEADLFSEQSLLCGGIPDLVIKTFEILVEKGIPPEVAYLECVHELGFMAKLFQQKGFYRTLLGASGTANFGGARAGEALIDQPFEAKLRELFDDIRTGRFKENLRGESEEGYPVIRKKMSFLKGHAIESVGEKLRAVIYNETKEKGEA